MASKCSQQSDPYPFVGKARDEGPTHLMTRRILEPARFVDIQKQLTHCIGGEATTLLTGKQQPAQVTNLGCNCPVAHSKAKHTKAVKISKNEQFENAASYFHINQSG
jgi:hypothetical protein